MPFEPSAVRLWKRLAGEDRRLAAESFWAEPAEDTLASALAAIVKARRLRPQVARALPADERARILASLLDPGEALAASLLVALHLGGRRAMLGALLDALKLPHENGVLKDEDHELAPVSEADARAAVARLRADFPEAQVRTYLNTLWLQDPQRWAALEACAD